MSETRIWFGERIGTDHFFLFSGFNLFGKIVCGIIVVSIHTIRLPEGDEKERPNDFDDQSCILTVDTVSAPDDVSIDCSDYDSELSEMLPRP